MEAFSGWELYSQEIKEPILKIGDPLIDKILNGGLRKGITEISGEAGTGKTSLGMQLLFQCALPTNQGGLNAKAVYLSTEGEPHRGRYDQLLKYYSNKYQDIDFGRNILMQNVNDLMLQETALFNLLPKTSELENVKLLILDNIATFYRLKTNYIHRAKEMNKTRQHLSRLSYKHKMIVVLINQVTDVFDTDILFTVSSFGSVKSSGRKVKPTLGLAWSNVINTRIMLARETGTYDLTGFDQHNQETYLKQSSSHVFRQFHIIYSPYIEKKWVNFEITNHGIRGLSKKQIQHFRDSMVTMPPPIINNNVTRRREESKRNEEEKKHEVFDGMNEQELLDAFGGSEPQQWNDTQIENVNITEIDTIMNDNNNNDETVGAKEKMQSEDEDIDIL